MATTEPQKLNIIIGVAAFSSPLLERLIRSCKSNRGHKVTVHITNNSPYHSVRETIRRARMGEFGVECVIHGSGKNEGLTTAWNDAIIGAFGDDPEQWKDDSNTVLILVNDDIVFDAAPELKPGDERLFLNEWDRDARFGWAHDGLTDIDRLAELAHSRRDVAAWYALGYNAGHEPSNANPADTPWRGMGWSVVALNPLYLRTVGMADENISPAYFEDCDYGYRAFNLSKLQNGELKQSNIFHGGSLTTRGNPEIGHWVQYAQAFNHYYISQKWGSDKLCPHWIPTFETPFCDPSFSLFIHPKDRARPYGPLYDRHDLRKFRTGKEGNPFQIPTPPEGMPAEYEQPVSERFKFKPRTGGNSIWDHIERLAEIAALPQVKTIVEVGTGGGDGSTQSFDLAMQEKDDGLHIGVCIHGVFPGWEPESKAWRFVEGDSREMETVEKVRELLGGRIPEIVYVDTEHTYDVLTREMQIWPLLGDENTLYLFHDVRLVISNPPMRQAVFDVVKPGGLLHETHEYLELWPTCSGLGCLRSKNGWGHLVPCPNCGRMVKPSDIFTCDDPYFADVENRSVEQIFCESCHTERLLDI